MHSRAARSKTKFRAGGDISQPARRTAARLSAGDVLRPFREARTGVRRSFRTPVRPHGTRQQPPLTRVPIVFDYILIQRCKSKKLCRARRRNAPPFHRKRRDSTKKSTRNEKFAKAEKTKKSRFPPRGGASAKRGRLRKTAAGYAKLTTSRQIRAAAGKPRRTPQIAAARLKTRKKRRSAGISAFDIRL